MAITKNICFFDRNMPPVIDIAQGTSALTINFNPVDLTVESTDSARIYVRKPSGLEVYNSCTVSNGLIIANIDTQMCAEVGEALCQLSVFKANSKVANSAVFFLRVMETVIDGSAVESTNEYTVLQGLISDAQDAIAGAEDAADLALSAVNNYFLTATYSYASGVHTLTIPAEYSSAKMLRFIPTQAWAEGDTLAIKVGTGTAVTYGAKTFTGEDIPDGAWASGASVTCTLNGTNAFFPVQPKPEAVEESTVTVSLGGNSTVTLRKYGKIIVGYFTLPGAWNAGVTTLSGLIPEGYRPSNNVRSAFCRAYGGTALSNNGMQLLVGGGGEVQLISTDSMTNSWSYQITLVWALA